MARQRFRVCYHCKNRYIGCHSECELYKAEKEQYAKEKEERSKMEAHNLKPTREAVCWNHKVLRNRSHKK